MVKKIIKSKDIEAVSYELLVKSKQIVVAGGCFDILHKGHLAFLKASKKQGDILVVLLESDARIRKLKGMHRPIHTQQDRARVLAHTPYVDIIILLPDKMTDELYDRLILQIKPAIITSTAQDPSLVHKKRQAKLVGASVKTVIDRIPDVSTTSLAERMQL